MRIPSLTRRSHTAQEDDHTDERPVVPDDAATVREQRDDRSAYHRRHGAEAEARRAEADQVEPMPRPRSSGLATVGLVLAVLAAAAVATGVLAAVGVALGVLAVLFGIGGVSATSRRHVAGRSEALFTVLLGLAAVVFGVLAFTDAFSWLSSDTNQVSRLRDWLYDQLTWLKDL